MSKRERTSAEPPTHNPGLTPNPNAADALVGLLKLFSARADLLREDEPAYTTEHDYEGSR